MTEDEFQAIIKLIQAHIVHARMTEGRQYDRPFMQARQRELAEAIEDARPILVPRRLRQPQAPSETSRDTPL